MPGLLSSTASSASDRSYRDNAPRTPAEPTVTQTADQSLAQVDLTRVADAEINSFKVTFGNKTITMPLPPNCVMPQRLQVIMSRNDVGGSMLEVIPAIQEKLLHKSSVVVVLSDGKLHLSPQQAQHIGGIYADVVEDDSSDDEATSGPTQPFDPSREILIRNTDTRTFQAFLRLCESPDPNHPAIKPTNVMKLLSLSHHAASDKALLACKAWLFRHVGCQQASINKPLFWQRMFELTQTPYSLWSDFQTSREITSANGQQSVLKEMKPGLLKQLLMLAFPNDVGRALHLPLSDHEAIQKLYQTIESLYQSGQLSLEKPPAMPQAPSRGSYPSAELLRCMATNAVDALRALLSNSENHKKFGLFETFKERSDLWVGHHELLDRWAHSNLLCDAIFAALSNKCLRINSGATDRTAPKPIYRHDTHYEALSYLLDVVNQECGPTVISETLNSPRGKALIKTAAAENDTQALKLLFDYGAKAKQTNRLGVLVARGNREAVQMFLSHDADPRENDALSVAAANGFKSIAKDLLKAGANPNDVLSGDSRRHDTPLNAAARAGHVDLIELFCRSNANVNAIHQRLEQYESHEPDLADVYLESYPRVITLVHLETPLIVALASGQTLAAEKLLSLGADPYLAVGQNRNAALIAAVAGDCNTVNNPPQSDTSLEHSSELKTDNLDILLRHDSHMLEDVNVPSAAECLHIAARAGHANLMRQLLVSPSFSSSKVKRFRSKDGETAHQIYRKSRTPDSNVLSQLKPSKWPLRKKWIRS